MKLETSYDLLVITGPTAAGKTKLAAAVAAVVDGEIISADSRQVYRGMDIGTGKDFSDYFVNGRKINCHLIDIAEPGYKYNVFEYQRDFRNVYTEMKQRGVFPIVCGGSGMYIDSIVSSYRLHEVAPDPGLRARLEKKSMEELTEILKSFRKLHNVTDIDTKKRVIRAIEIEHYNRSVAGKKTEFPKLKPLIAGINVDRDTRRRRISERLRERLDSGLVEEVRRLLGNGVSEEVLIYYGLEYKFITLYLGGKIMYDEMVSGLETAIHQYAKRQMTWFRGMERKGIKIHWIDSELPEETRIDMVLKLLIK
jgi:tRNA dimethylallyltransferase